MSSRMWRTVSDGIKSLRLTASLQSRFLGAQTASKIPKPKRPLSPYFRFMIQVREDIAKQNPSLPHKDLIKIIGQKWNKMDDASKEHYGASYKEEIGKYVTELAKYKDALSPEEKAKIQQMKLEKIVKKDRRVQRKRLSDLGKPKRPSTAFLQFIKANYTKKAGASSEDVKDQMKALAAKWNALSETEKEPFFAKYKKEVDAYETAILKWESQMLKQGNQDLVRAEPKPKLKRKAE